MAVLIPLVTAEKTVRVNITACTSQIEEIDRRARKAGSTRSAYMVQAATRGARPAVKGARRTTRSHARTTR